MLCRLTDKFSKAVFVCIKTLNDKSFKTGNATIKGVLPVQSQIQINNTKYTIERAFSGVKTPAMLIEERVLESKRKNVPLTSIHKMLYDETGGSVLIK